jgi:protein-S-isoprenylcysteine O-methyltransferase Ste14
MVRIADLSRYLIPGLWLLWLAWWLVTARDVKPAQWREGRRDSLVNRLPVIAGIVLLMLPSHVLPGFLTRLLWPPGPAGPFWGTLAVAAGLGFAIWARQHLGRNWSAEVSVKEGHTLIRSGPYRLVRHPIYSGITLAVAGGALAGGEVRGVLGLALIVAGFVVKLRLEEARMRATFPAEYADYCRHTARLIPGVY